MNQIPRCDWLPERARWSHLARSGIPAVSPKQNFTKRLVINPLLTKFVRSRWLDIGLVLSLRVSTSSQSINTQKKNLAKIRPSWPNKLGQYITHTYWPFFLLVYGPTVNWRFMNTQRLTINKVFIEWHKHHFLARNSWAIGNWVTEAGPDLEQRATGLD